MLGYSVKPCLKQTASANYELVLEFPTVLWTVDHLKLEIAGRG